MSGRIGSANTVHTTVLVSIFESKFAAEELDPQRSISATHKTLESLVPILERASKSPIKRDGVGLFPSARHPISQGGGSSLCSLSLFPSSLPDFSRLALALGSTRRDLNGPHTDCFELSFHGTYSCRRRP
jgi:hypothetical protein